MFTCFMTKSIVCFCRGNIEEALMFPLSPKGFSGVSFTMSGTGDLQPSHFLLPIPHFLLQSIVLHEFQARMWY